MAALSREFLMTLKSSNYFDQVNLLFAFITSSFIYTLKRLRTMIIYFPNFKKIFYFRFTKKTNKKT